MPRNLVGACVTVFLSLVGLSLAYLTKSILGLFSSQERTSHVSNPSGIPPPNQSKHVVDQAREVTDNRAVKMGVVDVGHVRGQRRNKTAMLVAAIGRHNLLLIGPPGEGKSMLAGTLPSYLPPMQQKEHDTLIAIYDIYGQRPPVVRPYRCVSPTITESTLVGGGQKITPGEISLAHAGVLFMDELPQYTRKIIDKLRAPMEDHHVTITRARESRTYPCNFQLIAAMNPCPCGYYGYGDRCDCSHLEIARYQGKISGPILDRIDMVISLEQTTSVEKFAASKERQSDAYYRQVCKAYDLQMKRQGCFNADIPGYELFNTHSPMFLFSQPALQTLKNVIDKEGFSSRKTVRLARVSRSISDFHGKNRISELCVKQAVSLVDSQLLS